MISNFVGEKDWAIGYLTLVDFIIAENSNLIEKIAPELYQKYGFLKRIRDNVNNLPEVKAYYER